MPNILLQLLMLMRAWLMHVGVDCIGCEEKKLRKGTKGDKRVPKIDRG